MGKTFLIVAAWGLLFVLNGFFPRKGRVLLAPSFMAAWLTIELAPWLLFWQCVGVAAFIASGALDDALGWLGLGVAALGAAGLGAMIGRSRKTILTLRDATEELEIADDAPTFPRSHVFFP